MMQTRRTHLVLFLSSILALVGGRGVPAADPATAEASTVVMVCEHGAVKSVIAALLFDQEAKQRGLSVRATSRGIDLYERIPEKIAHALEADGFRLSGFTPQELSRRDVSDATRVVAIGTDLSSFQGNGVSTILQWDDIPPVSVNYDIAKASIEAHIHALLDELEVQAAGD